MVKITVLSEQANGLVKNLKEFDKEDFDKFYAKLHEVTIVGTNIVFQYIEMKERGLWKEGNFIMPKEV